MVLIYAIRFKTEKFRYDGLSIFMVILITFVTLIGSLIGPPIAHAASYAQRIAAERNGAVHTVETAIADARCTGSVHAYVYDDSQIWASFRQDIDTITDWPITVNAELFAVSNKKNPSKEDIAAAFASIASYCGDNSSIRELWLHIEVQEEGVSTEYSVRITGHPILPISAEEMASRLIVRSDAQFPTDPSIVESSKAPAATAAS